MRASRSRALKAWSVSTSPACILLLCASLSPPLHAAPPPDTRPKQDDTRLAQVGIHPYESTHLKLYTDLDPELARPLPPLVDKAFEALAEYFGPLRTGGKEAPYQLTGYLIVERDRFQAAGLLPDALPQFFHGRYRGREFWLNDQTQDYYRRHLLIHEAVHCYMTAEPGPKPPRWYMEGMAELFGTHRAGADGSIEFGAFPAHEDEHPGFGRIELVQIDVKAGRLHSISDVTGLDDHDFEDVPAYAWSWALCTFLNSHPTYRDRFRALARDLDGPTFVAGLERSFKQDRPQLESEWQLFATGIEYAFDFERAAIEFKPGEPIDAAASVSVASDRGWQSSGVAVEAGHRYHVSADGRFTLADKPRPWVSEPQGISFDYAHGRPVGLLLGTIHVPGVSASMLEEFIVGREATFTASASGTLYLRINDHWRDLANNRGEVTVRIGAAD